MLYSGMMFLHNHRTLTFPQIPNRNQHSTTQVPSVVEAPRPTYLDTIKSRDNLVRNFPDLDPNLQTRNMGIRSGLTSSSEMLSRRSSGFSVTR